MVSFPRILLVLAVASPLVPLTFALVAQQAEFLKDWQSLLAGGLAIIAALIGAAMIQKQLDQSDQHHRSMLARQADADRAMLPFALHEMQPYLEQCGSILLDLWDQLAGSVLPHTFTMHAVPAPPQESIETFRSVIASSADENLREALADIVTALQIQSARLLSVHRQSTTRGSLIVSALNISTYAVDAAELLAKVGEFYAFARREIHSAPPPPSVERYYSALRQLGFDELDHEEIFERAARRAQRQLQQ
jgi:hypothetical protein